VLAASVIVGSVVASELPVQRRGKAPVAAGTTPISTALAQAYQNNPQLNAQRAATRAVDENVSIALGGYRPRVSATGSLTETYLETLSRSGATSTCVSGVNCGSVGAASYGVTATQTLFNGFQTGNRTRQAEAQVFSARELLRSTEQSVLLSAATAYMNLLRDSALLSRSQTARPRS
jgi:outer membrane protein